MIKRSKIDLAVGFFVAIGVLALVFLALKVGNLINFSMSEGYRLETRFDNIGGLKVRAPVKSAGVVVGRIETIQLDPETYEAVIDLRIEPEYRFTKDTIASVLTSGLLGEQYIGLESGGEAEFLKNGERVMKTQSAVILEKLIGQFLFNKAAEGPGIVK
ncbi:MAG: outer membrane lipid asymmetry maintenance protein MlaD [Hyphomicrobiales bacterium]